MSHTIPFDTLSYSKRMTKAGMKQDLAEEQATAISEIINDKIVTREYLDLRLNALDLKINSLYLKLTITLGSIMLTGLGLIKLLKL